MIVADANLLIYHFVQGVKTDLAHRVGELDDDWVVPPLWRHEFMNALALSVREAGMSLDQALSIYNEAHALLSARECNLNMTEALRLAAAHSISAYDAEYVVLARARNVLLVTEDRELLKKFPSTAISMSAFVLSRAGGSRHGTVREKRGSYSARRRKAVS